MTSGTAVGYWTAIVFEQMLKATLAKEGGNPAKVTGATLQQTVAGGQPYVYTDPIAGGIGTETFPAAETLPTGLRHPAQDRGGQLQAARALQVLLRHQRGERGAPEPADGQEGELIQA